LVYRVWEGFFTWTPSGSEEEDVDAREDDQAHASGLASLVDGPDDGDDKLAYKHTNGAVDEEHASTEPLNRPKGQRRRANVNSSRDHRDKESVLYTNRLEKGRAVVENYLSLVEL
jgi:hypothetical protein